jgi:hypothetical protein
MLSRYGIRQILPCLETPRSVRFSGATRIRDAIAGYLDAVRGNPQNGMVASLAFSRSSRINRRRM